MVPILYYADARVRFLNRYPQEPGTRKTLVTSHSLPALALLKPPVLGVDIE